MTWNNRRDTHPYADDDEDDHGATAAIHQQPRRHLLVAAAVDMVNQMEALLSSG